MIVLEMKAVVKPSQCSAIDEAIRTVQFIRNKALRLWMDAKREDKIDKYSLNKYCAVLAKHFKFVDTLNSTARQASAERAWSAIARFYDNCKKKVKGKKGYPKWLFGLSYATYRVIRNETLIEKDIWRFLLIGFDLERTNQLNLLPDKDSVDLCPHIEPY